jgi:5-formyltetrahydrofolate cyclo-ligase
MDKTGFRKEAKARLHAMDSDREKRSLLICGRIAGMLKKAETCSLAAYMAMETEPMLASLMSAWLDSGGKLYLPRYDKASRDYEMVAVHDLEADLAPGYYGILEPRMELAGSHPPYDGDRSMIWLIPGLGFDLSGHRLGRGGGYYDRLLNGATGMKIGVGYDCQIFDALPFESHDIGVDYVVTETRIVDCGWHTAR